MKKLMFASALFGAVAAFAVVPEFKYGIVKVPEGATVTADEAKTTRETAAKDKFFTAERVTLSMNKVDAATVAAVLAAFPEASTVELRYSAIDDMAVFAAMPNMKKLDLYGSTVKDFAPLAACRKLETLNYYAVKGPQTAFDSLGALTQLKSLTGGLSEVKSLAFLEKLPQLEEFVVFAEGVDSLAPIGALVNLKRVDIWNMTGDKVGRNKVPAAGDLSYLAGCVKLEKLELPGSLYSNTEALAGLKNVKDVRLSGARGDVDVSFVKGYEKMTYFTANGARGKVTGLDALAGKTALKAADLSGLFDADIAFAAKVPALDRLDISSGNAKKTRNVANFTALAGAPRLTSLHAFGCVGIDFDTIKSLPKLGFLTVSKGALTDAQIAELKAAKPKMRVNVR